MNAFLPVLITVAVVVPMCIGIFYFHRYIHHHHQPDLSRLKIYRVLLCLSVLFAIYFTADALCVTKGAHLQSYLFIGMGIYLIISNALYIREIKKKLNIP